MQSDDLIIEAKKHLGEMQLYTGEDDTLPWCARFIVSCMKDMGMNPPDTWSAKGLYDWCEPIADDDVREGDLVCFNFDGRQDTSWFDHIGIVLWFDHGSGTYKTIEGNSGSDYSVECYKYDNSEYPPKTYFCRPPYEEKEDDLYMSNDDGFNEIWFGNTLNGEKTDAGYTTPANMLWGCFCRLGKLESAVAELAEAVKRLER